MEDRSFVKNAADPAQVRAGKKSEKIKRKNEEMDLRWFLSERRGRRIYWKLLERCGVFQTSFSGKDSETNFKEGSRNVGLKLLADLNVVSPEAYPLMVQEAKEDMLKYTKGKKDTNNE